MAEIHPELPVHPIFRPFTHHSTHSGFEPLEQHLGKAVSCPRWVYRVRGLGPLHRYVRRKSGMEWYDGLYLELAAAWHMRTHSRRIYHFIAAENDFRYLPSFAPMDKHIVIGTFHATHAEFQRVMKHTAHLQKLDAAVVVSRGQIPLLEAFMEKGKIFFVPLGVNTAHFTPGTRRSDDGSRVCLCVGHHLRDFDTLCRVAAIVRTRDADARFVLIDRVFSKFFSAEVQQQYKEKFVSAGNIQLITDAGEEELLRHYQTSDLMALPLFDTTANIAVLEALSCGLPLVVTDTGGVRDYADPDCALFAPPQNPEVMAEQILELLKDRKALQERSRACRRRALELDWSVIAAQLHEIYQTLSSQ